VRYQQIAIRIAEKDGLAGVAVGRDVVNRAWELKPAMDGTWMRPRDAGLHINVECHVADDSCPLNRHVKTRPRRLP